MPDWFDPEWLKPYDTKGESVHLEESDKKSVKLALIQTRSDSRIELEHGSTPMKILMHGA